MVWGLLFLLFYFSKIFQGVALIYTIELDAHHHICIPASERGVKKKGGHATFFYGCYSEVAYITQAHGPLVGT